MNQPTLFDTPPAPRPSTAPARPTRAASHSPTAPASTVGSSGPAAASPQAAPQAAPWRSSDGRVVLAVDGNSLLHRAFHAYSRSELSGDDGRPTFAVYGFFALLAGIADKVDPDGIVVGFDSRVSVRKQRWAHYKATRSPADPSLYAQMDEVVDLLGRLGVCVVSVEGWEADDVVASVATAATADGHHCVVATSDRDSFALISESVTVLRLGSGLDNAVAMTPEVLHDTCGVRPDQYLSFAALRGDPSDNLPGVRGIGAKTAAKLLAELDVPAAIADQGAAAAVIGPANAAKLAAAADVWAHNCEVMALRRDLDVPLAAVWLDTDASTVADVLGAAGQRTLIARMTAALRAAPALEVGAGDDGWDVELTDADEPF